MVTTVTQKVPQRKVAVGKRSSTLYPKDTGHSTSSEDLDLASETLDTGGGGVLLKQPIIANTMLDLLQDIDEL